MCLRGNNHIETKAALSVDCNMILNFISHAFYPDSIVQNGIYFMTTYKFFLKKKTEKIRFEMVWVAITLDSLFHAKIDIKFA